MPHIIAKMSAGETQPDSDPARDATENLVAALSELCLNPGLPACRDWAWYSRELFPCLREYQAAWTAERREATVVTEIGQAVADTLDYALASKCMVLVDGLARIGKTFAARAWCAQHPGRARYVQVPSTNDDIGFFRAIAKALGVSINLNSKAQELRHRIEEALQPGDLALVFDEAHFCWPSTTYRDALPGRINWIMTALVNCGVPVALVTTPQFMRTQKRIESRSCWTSEQFVGRIGLYKKLPDSLSASDLGGVAKSLLPEGDDKAIELLICYAQGSAKYLAGIESAVNYARYLAGRAGRERATCADVKRAIRESVIPSDSALAEALAAPGKPGRGRTVQPAINERLTASIAPVSATTGEHREESFFRRASPSFSEADSPRIGGGLVPA